MSSIKSPVNTGNLKVVVLCLIAATTFWFFQALNESYTTTISYPVVFDFDRNNYIALEEPPNEIQLNVQGVGWNILRKGYLGDVNPIYASLENPAQLTAIRGQQLRNDVVSQIGEELELNYIVNDSLKLNIDRRVSKRVKVYIDSAGIDLRDSYYITSRIGTSLDSVTLQGPSSLIKDQSDSLRLIIPETRLDESYNEDIQLFSGNSLITIIPESMNVRFKIELFVEVESTIPLGRENFPADSSYDIVPESAVIKYLVSENNEGNINPEDFNIVARFDRMVSADSTIQPLIIDYPESIRNVRITSSRVRVVKVNKNPFLNTGDGGE